MEKMEELNSEYEHPIKEFWVSFSANRGAVIGLVLILFFVFLAIFAPLLAPHSPSELQESALRLPPAFYENGDTRFFFGTDDVGRDL